MSRMEEEAARESVSEEGFARRDMFRWEGRRDEHGPMVRTGGMYLELREPRKKCAERGVVVLREVDRRQAGERKGGEYARGAHAET
jgi:hypothetical protein